MMFSFKKIFAHVQNMQILGITVVNKNGRARAPSGGVIYFGIFVAFNISTITV